MISCGQDGLKIHSKSAAKRLPAFQLPNMDGQMVSSEELLGKVVVLNFFATWCGPCVQELPHLEKDLWQAYRDQGVVVLAVNSSEDEQTVRDFMAENGYTFPVLFDSDQRLASEIGVRGIPHTVVADRDLHIRGQVVGFSPQGFEKLVNLVGELSREAAAGP